ncbi:hypothetical protein SCP_0213660 [Sparassis crispa]|uniref:Uncharacterized protein n=1 Tax=Sparassis crispa TaxID=139825 RepID=A0A401GDC3_9APHY|nr:hypothetical protein SCP_0213660 [Sparassis crispa]GBE80160.1 hypothetical protein SCP_0213660 [Sparassis crispa]
MSTLGITSDELYGEALPPDVPRPTPEREQHILNALDGAFSVVSTMNSGEEDPEWDVNDVAQTRATVAAVFRKLLSLNENMDFTALKGAAAVELYFALNPSRRPKPIPPPQPLPQSAQRASARPLQARNRTWHQAVSGSRVGVGPSPLRRAVIPEPEDT